MKDTIEHFDAVVIGSGFGGSVMTYRLAAAGMRVCLLERGRRYPPGSFARSPAQMSKNFWDPSEGHYGLFQIWRFGGIDGLVSAGLGGGSLIYANVLLRKDADWFVRRCDDGSLEEWPITREDLEDHYDQVERILAPQTYPIDFEPYSSTAKTHALRDGAESAGLQWFLPPLAVTFANAGRKPIPGEPIQNGEINLHHCSRATCRLCGECDIGCNYGSKNTLDYNYLSLAQDQGAQIRDLCEVREMAPIGSGDGYTVSYVQHEVERDGVPSNTKALPLTTLSASRLVLSAGTFGSTYLLFKNRERFPGLSEKLGHFMSGNGDFLGFVHDAHRRIGGARRTRALEASRGTVITSTVRIPRNGSTGGFYIQEGGYPGVVDWLVEVSGMGILRRALRFAERRILGRVRGSHSLSLNSEVRALLGDAHRSSSLLPLLGMGLDTPDGLFCLDRKTQELQLDWTSRGSDEFFTEVEETMKEIARGLDAKLQVDPIWYLDRKVITVHPVGGCSIGRTREDGVIDRNGEVFGFPGFVVADGSVMPGPVGPNPSLTIAAIANKFAEHQIDK